MIANIIPRAELYSPGTSFLLHYSGGSHDPTHCVVCGKKLTRSGTKTKWTFNAETFASPPNPDAVPCGKLPMREAAE